MQQSEVEDALASLWVLVQETSPIVIGSQSVHGTVPDLADTLVFSREVDVILPNKAKIGKWLSEVVGDNTPFEANKGYYIDHVIPQEGCPVLAINWDSRAIRRPLIYNGKIAGETRYLSLADLAISKLAAAREKDFIFVERLIATGHLQASEIIALIDEVPTIYQQIVLAGIKRVSAHDTPRTGVQRNS